MKDETLLESDNEDFRKKIGEVLTRFQEIEFAYLFGSFLESDAFILNHATIIFHDEAEQKGDGENTRVADKSKFCSTPAPI